MSNCEISPRNFPAVGLACVFSRMVLAPTAFTKPIAERIPPPFLIDILTWLSYWRAYHKLASEVKLPKLVSSVLTKFLLPSKNTFDLPNLLPSLAIITLLMALQMVLTLAPFVPVAKASL